MLNNLARNILLVVITAGLCSCKVRFRDDTRSVTYDVPGLAGPECSRELLSILTRTGGVKEASPDLENRTVTVSYDSRTVAEVNIEHAIAKGGFDVNDTPADPEAQAKLPETCR